jgi:hypothetical protein
MFWVHVSPLLAVDVLHSRHSRDVEGRVEGRLGRRRLLCVRIDGGQYWFRWTRAFRLLARCPLLLIHLELLRGLIPAEEGEIVNKRLIDGEPFLNGCKNLTMMRAVSVTGL